MRGLAAGKRPLGALAAVGVSLALQLISAQPSAATVTHPERSLFRLVNQDRHRQGVAPLRLSAPLSRFSHRHSRAMASRRALFHHSCLDCIRRRHGWVVIGENVGYASTVRSVNRLFMHSAPHRRNILCTCFTRVGIGIVRSGGRVWVTEMLYRP
jgi:uncharacterized protein YkwD